MKKKLTLLLAAFLVFGLTSCKKQNNKDKGSSEESVPVEVESDSQPTEESTPIDESEEPGESEEKSEGESEQESEQPGESEGDSEEPHESESEQQEKYQVTFGSGSSIRGYDLSEDVLDDDDVKMNVVKKYSIHNGLMVYAGDPITFYYNENVIQPGDEKVDGKDNGNNTQGEYPNYTVRQEAVNASLYLKVYEGGYSFWLTGYDKPAETMHGPEGSEPVDWYIAGQGSIFEYSWDLGNSIRMYSNPDNTEDKACILSVTFAVGDKFKIVNVGFEDKWYGYEIVNTANMEENAGIKAFGPTDDGFHTDKFNIECLTAGTYDIYVQSTGAIWITYSAALV